MVLEIRPLTPSDGYAALTDLLHRAYASLAEQGLEYYASHQTIQQTRERIGDATCLLAFEDRILVGTVLYQRPGSATGQPYYERPGVARLSQFAVEPELQGQGYGRALLGAVTDLARSDGASELALDTAVPAKLLIRIYARWGFTVVGEADWRPLVNYPSVIMALRLPP